MKVTVCDWCGNEMTHDFIERITEGFVQVMVMDQERGEWLPMDLCSQECVMKGLGLIAPDPEEINADPDPDLPQLEPVEVEDPQTKAPVLSMDDRIANEKRYKEQAAEMSQYLGVKNRSKGER